MDDGSEPMRPFEVPIRKGEGHYDKEKGAPVYQGLAEAKGYNQDKLRLQKVAYSHDALIDLIIANPRITQAQMAATFGYTTTWISRIIGSDAFQAALAERRREITDPFLIATIGERLHGLAIQSLEIVAKKLEATESADMALKALDLSVKAMGFGARDRTPTNVQNNYVVALPPKAGSVEDWAAAAQNGAYEVLKSAKSADILPFSTTVTRDPTEQPKSMEILEDDE